VPEQVGDAAFLEPPRPGPDDQFVVVQQPGFAPRLFKGAGHFLVRHCANALGFSGLVKVQIGEQCLEIRVWRIPIFASRAGRSTLGGF
jgi:hypothetical protein